MTDDWMPVEEVESVAAGREVRCGRQSCGALVPWRELPTWQHVKLDDKVFPLCAACWEQVRMWLYATGFHFHTSRG
jgi:hypothetical protein